MKTMDFSTVIDWMSIKLLGSGIAGIALMTITGSTVIAFLSGIAFFSTIVYNAIKIYNELKNKNNGKDNFKSK